MLRLVHEGQSNANETVISELELTDENEKPTPLLLGLLTMEILFDLCLGYLAYRVCSALKL